MRTDRASSQQSSIADTHSRRLGLQIAFVSSRYKSTPPANIDSLGFGVGKYENTRPSDI